jgi:hypothetical protein
MQIIVQLQKKERFKFIPTAAISGYNRNVYKMQTVPNVTFIAAGTAPYTFFTI